MELMTLDENFVPVGNTKLKFFDLLWDRKYYETGQFSVQIKASDYIPRMQYIYAKERSELGIIQCVQYTDSDYMVVLSGSFYEKRLRDKIVYPVFNGYGNRSVLARSILSAHKGDIPIELGTFVNEGEEIQKQETGGELEGVIQTLLQMEEKAIRCRYEYAENTMYMDIWQGVNRTQSQTEHNFVTFSKGFRNIKNVAAKEDSSNIKNYFIVAGNGEGADSITVVVDLSGGGYKRQLFVDCKNEKYDSDKQTIEEYKAGLYQKGLEKAQTYVNIHNVEFDALADGGFKYLEDYNLGDKCDIIIEETGSSYEARIIEILETWNKGVHTVTVTFGDKIPTIYERARVK